MTAGAGNRCSIAVHGAPVPGKIQNLRCKRSWGNHFHGAKQAGSPRRSGVIGEQVGAQLFCKGHIERTVGGEIGTQFPGPRPKARKACCSGSRPAKTRRRSTESSSASIRSGAWILASASRARAGPSINNASTRTEASTTTISVQRGFGVRARAARRADNAELLQREGAQRQSRAAGKPLQAFGYVVWDVTDI